jgi:thymidylate kinase
MAKHFRIPAMIHFFGPDGSGKSTHVELLLKKLKDCEPKISKCWLRSPHTFAFLLWRLLVRIGFCRVMRNPMGIEIKLPAVDRSKSLRSFWALAEFFSVLPLIARIDFAVQRGRKFVAERYILDTVATVAFFVNDLGFLESRTARLLFRFIPKDTIFIFLDSDFKTIFKRREHIYLDGYNQKGRVYGMVPRSAVEPEEFIDFQRRAYKILAEFFGAFVIDTSKSSIKKTSDTILNYLQSPDRPS